MAYDVKRQLRELYAPKNTDWQLVEVPRQRFLGIDGQGNPNTSPVYAEAVQALYAVAYAIKFAIKRSRGEDFVVAPLEGLWWAPDPAVFTTDAKDLWHWTMLISQPSWASDELVKSTAEATLANKQLPAIARIAPVQLAEGLCAQVLHVGPYAAEGPILAKLHEEYIPANGLQPVGQHHEVYVGDPRKSDPAKLKTVIRQPVRRKR